jgi:hypothetical protein
MRRTYAPQDMTKTPARKLALERAPPARLARRTPVSAAVAMPLTAVSCGRAGKRVAHRFIDNMQVVRRVNTAGVAAPLQALVSQA